MNADAELARLVDVINGMLDRLQRSYNQDDGLIRLDLKAKDGTARFTLANTGHPISPEDREKVFDRFYRVDKSHSRKIDGSGLGLSLAREKRSNP